MGWILLTAVLSFAAGFVFACYRIARAVEKALADEL